MSRRRLLGLLGALGLVGCTGGRTRTPAGVVRRVEAYGDGPLARGEWWVPDRPGRLPTVVLVHGGYWEPGYDRSLEDPVAADLAGRGYLVWNVDYRAADAAWPATLLDVAAAHDHAARDARVDPARTAVVGHSAGGHLALWLASRRRLPAGAPGADPSAPPPALCVAQAPVAALVEGVALGLGGGAVPALLDGTPDDVPDRYAVTDPVALAPTGVPTVLLHSARDDLVPLSQSEAYVAADPAARLVRVPGDHFAHLDPRSSALDALRAELVAL